MPRYQHLVIVVTLLVLTAGVATAAPRGEPSLSVHLPNDHVTPGEETTLQLFVLNGGELETGGRPSDEQRVTTARNVRVTLTNGSAPIEINTDTQPVGNVPEGSVGPIDFAISVKDTAEPGTYRLPVEVEYTYTNAIVHADPSIPDHQESSRTITTYVTLRIEETAQFDIKTASLTRIVDGTGQFAVTVRNVGSAPAREAQLTVRSQDSRLTFGQTGEIRTFAGKWEPGENRTVTVEADVADGVDDRTVPIALDVAYTDSDDVRRQSQRLTTGVTIGSRSDRFSIQQTGTDIAVGDSGVVTLTMQHTGDAPVRDIRITVQSTDSTLTFGGKQRAETYLGRLQPGGSRQLVFEAGIAATADLRSYPIAVTVSYRVADERRQTDQLVAGIAPQAERVFRIRNVTSELYVGEQQSVRLTVVNTGSDPVRAASLHIETPDRIGLTVREHEQALGTIPPGGARTVSIPVTVDGDAEPLAHRLTAHIEYHTSGDDPEVSKPFPVTVEVLPERDRLTATGIETNVSIDTSNRLVLSVRNRAETTFHNVSVRLSPTPPFSSVSPTAHVTELAPGETATVTFELSVADDAVPSTHGIGVVIAADEPDGDRYRSRGEQVVVRVMSQGVFEQEWSVVVIGAGAVIVILGLGYWYTTYGSRQ
ncbi:MAG: NEW3 domain-containing protein [Halobacteriales archaeon]|nr:NEW3 domain-containing protein [Halobacteriales archaeon]